MGAPTGGVCGSVLVRLLARCAESVVLSAAASSSCAHLRRAPTVFTLSCAGVCTQRDLWAVPCVGVTGAGVAGGAAGVAGATGGAAGGAAADGGGGRGGSGGGADEAAVAAGGGVEGGGGGGGASLAAAGLLCWSLSCA